MLPDLGNVIVTGGASGLGAAVAGAVSQRGGCPIVIDRRQGPGCGDQEIADLADTQAAESAVHRVLERHGRLHAVVTCAGIDHPGTLGDVPRADWEQVIAVNLQENAARIRPFAEKLGLDFPIVRDHDGSVTRAWAVRVFPTTFVVGPDQRIALVAIGDVEWDAPDVLSRVRAVARGPGALPAGTRAEIFPTPFPRSSLWIAALS